MNKFQLKSASLALLLLLGEASYASLNDKHLGIVEKADLTMLIEGTNGVLGSCSGKSLQNCSNSPPCSLTINNCGQNASFQVINNSSLTVSNILARSTDPRFDSVKQSNSQNQASGCTLKPGTQCTITLENKDFSASAFTNLPVTVFGVNTQGTPSTTTLCISLTYLQCD